MIGFSTKEFDENFAFKELKRSINTVMAERKLSVDCCELVSGLTNIGIPRLAYKLAKDIGMHTVGLIAREAISCGVELYPVSKQIIVGDIFGDESKVFVEYIDVLIRIGGDLQSLNEVNLFINKLKRKSQCAGLSLYQMDL